MKIDADEKELLESVDRGEWKSAGGGDRGPVGRPRPRVVVRAESHVIRVILERRGEGRRFP
jgi:hypothetical protein